MAVDTTTTPPRRTMPVLPNAPARHHAAPRAPFQTPRRTATVSLSAYFNAIAQGVGVSNSPPSSHDEEKYATSPPPRPSAPFAAADSDYPHYTRRPRYPCMATAAELRTLVARRRAMRPSHPLGRLVDGVSARAPAAPMAPASALAAAVAAAVAAEAQDDDDATSEASTAESVATSAGLLECPLLE